MRLLQVRSAIFGIYLIPGPQASIRASTGLLNGEPQNCVLVAIGAGKRAFSGGRNWEESEYCVDSKSGLLTQYSPAPGLFVRYDYSSGIKFHNTFVPTTFSIVENGRVVVEARTISATEPPAATDPMFDTAGLTAIGSGPVMNRWGNIPMILPAPGQRLVNINASAVMQVVSLHGDISGDGHLSEVEILASTNPSLHQAAADQATSMMQGRAPAQPGATVQSSEVFLTFEFVTSGQ